VKKTTRFVIWICSKFTHKEIEQIIQGLMEVLANRNPEVKPKDDFKEKHPNYRNFFVDPEPPLKAPPQKAHIFILTMVKNAHSLSVRSALLYHRYILVIGIRLAIFALIVAIHFIFGKNEKMSLSINATMTDAHPEARANL